MAELKDTAEQFAKDLAAQNIAGLMMAFTTEGMTAAMSLQAQLQGAGPQSPVTGVDVELHGQDGDDHLVDLVMKNAEGQAVIGTKWRDVAGAWKCNDMALKS